MRSPRIGVVLSSGGTRGVYAHTGFLIALERLGIPVAAATGSSAGAVVGGMAASGADLHAWSETIAHIAPARFWRPDPVAYVVWQFLIRRGRGYTGLSSPEAAIEFCRSQLAVQTFEECRYPFYALAVSLGRGRKVVFSEGQLAPRIAASAPRRCCTDRWRSMAIGTATARWLIWRRRTPSAVNIIWMR
jgi:NTE family protein